MCIRPPARPSRSPLRASLAALLAAACGTAAPAGSTGTPPGPDAGATADAGTCVPVTDTDGTGATGPVISEILPGAAGFLELFDGAGAGVARSDAELRVGGVPRALPADLPAGGRLLVTVPGLPADGEVVLRVNGVVTAYACWGGFVPGVEQNAAVASGAWLSPGSCALRPAPGESLHATGTARNAGDFVSAAPTPPNCP